MSWAAKLVIKIPSCWDVPGKEDLIESLREEIWKTRMGMTKQVVDYREKANKKKGEANTLIARGRISDARDAAQHYCEYLFISQQIDKGIPLADQIYIACEVHKVIRDDKFVFCQEVFDVVCKIFSNREAKRLFQWVIDELVRLRIAVLKSKDEVFYNSEKEITNPYNCNTVLKSLMK